MRCAPGEMMDFGSGKSFRNFTCGEWGKNRVFFPKTHPPIPTDSVDAQQSHIVELPPKSPKIVLLTLPSCWADPVISTRLVLLFSDTQPGHGDTSQSVAFPCFSCPFSLCPSPAELSFLGRCLYFSLFSHLVSAALLVVELCVSGSSFSPGNFWLPPLEYSE